MCRSVSHAFSSSSLCGLLKQIRLETVWSITFFWKSIEPVLFTPKTYNAVFHEPWLDTIKLERDIEFVVFQQN